jgi:putative alpha-1,2-mannosidase
MAKLPCERIYGKTVVLLLAAGTACGSVTQYVNPIIGTGGSGGLGGWGNAQLNPGAQLPFSCMRLGPDSTIAFPYTNQAFQNNFRPHPGQVRIASDEDVSSISVSEVQRLPLRDANGTQLWVKFDHYAGYNYIDNGIRAFSHTHLQGGGMDDLGNFGVMVARSFSAADAQQASQTAPYWSHFQHATEIAQPGYYSAILEDAATTAEVTISGSHSGAHRYTCNPAMSQNGSSLLPCIAIIDICHVTHTDGCPFGNVSVTQLDNFTLAVVGSTLDAGDFANSGPLGGVYVYIYGLLTAAINGTQQKITPSQVQLWADTGLLPVGTMQANSTQQNIGATVTFPSASTLHPTIISFRVGISFVSQNRAQTNLLNQQTYANGSFMAFDDIAAAADATWEALLSRVVVTPAAFSAEETLPQPEDVFGRPRVQQSFEGLHPTVRAKVVEWLESEDGEAFRARQAAVFNTKTDIESTLQGMMEVVAAGRAAAATQRQALGATTDLVVFYTSLYHLYCAPTTYSESDGTYLGFDGLVHQVWNATSMPTSHNLPRKPDTVTAAAASPVRGRFLSDLSCWDIFRTQTPWLAVAAPDVLADMTKSLAAMTNQGGHLPRWPFANVFSDVMQGMHAVEIMVDGIIKGITSDGFGLDLPQLYNITKVAINKQDASTRYAVLGYVPQEDFARGASNTLEYALDDYTAATFAALMGDSESEALWRNRSTFYQNVWNPDIQVMCPRWANGTFLIPFDLSLPHPFNPWYTEGDSVQWEWFVQHDVAALVALFPNTTAYIDALNTVMYNEIYWPIGTVLPNPWYWAGNEPDILVPWQFPFAGAQYANYTQYWTRWLLTTFYTTNFDGIPGNDDYGMWFMATKFFPVFSRVFASFSLLPLSLIRRVVQARCLHGRYGRTLASTP